MNLRFEMYMKGLGEVVEVRGKAGTLSFEQAFWTCRTVSLPENILDQENWEHSSRLVQDFEHSCDYLTCKLEYLYFSAVLS